MLISTPAFHSAREVTRRVKTEKHGEHGKLFLIRRPLHAGCVSFVWIICAPKKTLFDLLLGQKENIECEKKALLFLDFFPNVGAVNRNEQRNNLRKAS